MPDEEMDEAGSGPVRDQLELHVACRAIEMTA